MRYMALRLLVVMSLFAVAARAEWTAPTWQETTLLAASETLLAVDMLQTLDRRFPEKNPILGAYPSKEAVLAYFGVTALALGASWYLLPPRWRNVVPGVAIVVELPVVIRNHAIGVRITLPF
jgi:hypothetical protein